MSAIVTVMFFVILAAVFLWGMLRVGINAPLPESVKQARYQAKQEAKKNTAGGIIVGLGFVAAIVAFMYVCGAFATH
jgi:hypothetical protein